MPLTPAAADTEGDTITLQAEVGAVEDPVIVGIFVKGALYAGDCAFDIVVLYRGDLDRHTDVMLQAAVHSPRCISLTFDLKYL